MRMDIAASLGSSPLVKAHYKDAAMDDFVSALSEDVKRMSESS